jgi:hypothetical protein
MPHLRDEEPPQTRLQEQVQDDYDSSSVTFEVWVDIEGVEARVYREVGAGTEQDDGQDDQTAWIESEVGKVCS